MRKPKNTDSKHLFRDDLKITATKAKTSNNMFKKSTNRYSNSNNLTKVKFPFNRSQNQDFLYHGHKASSSNQKNRRFNTKTAVQIIRPRTSMCQRQGNRNFAGNRFPWNYVHSWEPEILLASVEKNNFWSSYFEYYKWKFADTLQNSYSM